VPARVRHTTTGSGLGGAWRRAHTRVMRVLVVEDSKALRERLVATIAGFEGVHSVIEACDTPSALATCSTAKPDVITLDLHIPGGGGFAVLDSLPAAERPEVIVLSAHATPQYRQRCARAGVRHFFDKAGELGQAVDLVARLARDRARRNPTPVAQRALRERSTASASLAALATLLDVKTECFWVLDETTRRVSMVSPGFEHVFGLSMYGFVEQPEAWLDRVRDEDVKRVGNWHDTDIDEEVRVELPDGGERTVHLKSHVTRDGDGPVTSVLVFARDTTGVHQLEAELEEARRLETLGRVSSGVAHDFNNLLTTMECAADFVAQARVPAEVIPDVELIRATCARGHELTRRILTIGRGQATDKRELNLNEIVTNTIDLAVRMIGPHVEIRAELAEDLADLRGDSFKLEQIVLNLLLRARDSLGGEGRVSVRTANVVDAPKLPKEIPAPAVELTVTDSGAHLDSSSHSGEFEAWEPRGLGAGLGLNTVRDLCTDHGGRLALEQTDAGARVTVLLPALRGPHMRFSEPLDAKKIGGKETILVVDDDLHVRKVLMRSLTRQGYRVLEAADPQTAAKLHAEANGNVDLLVADVMLPRTTGTALARELLARSPKLRVLLISGNPAENLQALGAPEQASFLRKPFGPKDLAQRVRQLLDVSDEEVKA